jgi:polyisoprenoid-binding protein YceI
MKKLVLNTLMITLLFGLFSFDSVKVSADKGDSFLRYNLSHPMHESIGTSKDFICNAYYDNVAKQINKIAIAATVASFDSKNSSRDSHALEVLEAIKYPKVTFVSTSIKDNGNELIINGELNFHGVKRDITIKADQSKSASEITLKGDFYVSLDKHKVEKPSMMGVAVDDNLHMDFKIKFNL